MNILFFAHFSYAQWELLTQNLSLKYGICNTSELLCASESNNSFWSIKDILKSALYKLIIRNKFWNRLFYANDSSSFPTMLKGQPIRAPHYFHAFSGALWVGSIRQNLDFRLNKKK